MPHAADRVAAYNSASPLESEMTEYHSLITTRAALALRLLRRQSLDGKPNPSTVTRANAFGSMFAQSSDALRVPHTIRLNEESLP